MSADPPRSGAPALDEERRARILTMLRFVQEDTRGLHALMGMRLVDWEGGTARVQLDVAPQVENPNRMLHGGAIATLVDHAGTIAILAADRESRPGVTTDLNVTYLLPTSAGDSALAEARVLRSGRTLAYVTVDVRRVSDGALVAQGRMTKFLG